MKRQLLFFLLSLVLGVPAMKAQDYFVNVENWPVQQYLSEVTYNLSSLSKIEDYIGNSAYQRLDYPNAFRLPLPWGMNEGLVLTYSANEDFSDSREIAVSDGDYEVPIYNLIPQCTYYYKLEDAFGNVVAEGTIQTRGRVRMIYAPSLQNVRDLGGWETEDGRRIKYGKLYRGSELNGSVHATQQDINMLLDLGIGAELDMRKAEEQDATLGVGYSSLGFSAEQGTYLNNLENGCYSTHLFADKYLDSYRKDFDFIMANLKAGRPVYMHCVYGADRTGMLALLIEGMLGISYDHMAKDYELTSMSNWSGVRLKTRYFDSIIRYMNRFSGSTVQERIVSFLKSRVKMTNEEIDYLRSELLEDTEQKSNDGGLTTSVEQPIQAAKSQSTAYDLTGRRIAAKRGIAVKNGRKYVVR